MKSDQRFTDRVVQLMVYVLKVQDVYGDPGT
jgi:hypothetical protein